MKNYLFPLNAIHKDGTVILLYTLDEVYDFINKYGKFHDYRTSTKSTSEYYYDHTLGGLRHKYSWKTTENDWIVRDDRGKIVKYDDIPSSHGKYYYYSSRLAEIRKIAEKGLPIPHTGRRRWKKMNHTAKKNSGAGHRNRNRSRCEHDRKEYGIKNPYGKPINWEGY